VGKSSSPDLDENFEALLNWLDPDRERAGEMYETIRQQLIKMFAWSQCQDPDDLADETIDRVMRRVREIRQSYSGDPRLYFFGVAKNILHEARRKPRNWPLDETEIMFQTETDENSEQLYECLDKCMLKLPPDRRALLLSYYQGSKRAKIDARRELAAKFDLRPAALRMVVYRTLNKLETCIQECMKGQSRHSDSLVESN
jgi:RNA polymerase sigma factor (sigma-70 family)